MQYKFEVSIEIKQLKKLNKFKKRPSEICPSNKKRTIFVHDQLNKNLTESLSNFFTTAPAKHCYNTRGSHNKASINSITNSVIYELNSANHRPASDWNAIIKH